MADGRVAYLGPVAEVGAHFSSLGFAMPPHTNPAEHIMKALVVRACVRAGGDHGIAKM
jgi:hypothetical protein